MHKISFNVLLTALALALIGTSPAQAAGHEAVSADAAAQAMAQGASVVDVRSASAYAQGHLPQAVRLPSDAAAQSLEVLQQWVSNAGADLSRTVLVVGEPGDVNAQALWHTLSGYATGRVLWLVGGTTEWQMTGRALSVGAVQVKAVPQYLVRLHNAPADARMAGHSVRATAIPAIESGQVLVLN
jgi:3-mercaptopyruvate sulfurtransferase SseA